jgi:hypothetical protein
VLLSETGALFSLNLGVHLALGAVGAKNRAHYKPEDEAEQDSGRERKNYVPADVIDHLYRIRRARWESRAQQHPLFLKQPDYTLHDGVNPDTANEHPQCNARGGWLAGVVLGLGFGRKVRHMQSDLI